RGIEFARHGIRVADTLPGLIDTPILRNTPNRTDGTKPTEDQLKSQTKGTFRLMPPEAVAEAVWGAYGTDKTHWYVPPELVWIDRMKVFLPRYIRGKIGKSLPGSE
ncbi:MAG: short-chain dehydrogenase, partial [Alphaproteobacteria bacterium]|nr:short-chain dehydrogenase [Alphaproteobacteria bacterium]